MEQEDQSMELRYHVEADEVFSALNKVDVLTGAVKKNRAVFGMLMIVVALYIIVFFRDRNGICLILAAVFAALGIFVRQRAMKGNAALAKAFEEEPEQLVHIQWTQLQLGERTIGYQEVKKLYEFKQSFVIWYQENRYYVIPKRVFEEGQMEEFVSQMKAQLEEKYEDQSQRL